MAHTGGRVSILIAVLVKSNMAKLKFVTSSEVTLSKTKNPYWLLYISEKDAPSLSKGPPPTAQGRGIRL